MGRPPPPIIRAMPERKRFFSIDVFPNVNYIFDTGYNMSSADIQGGMRGIPLIPQ